MKTCSRCQTTKPFSLFYKQSVNSRDGYQAHCKQCDNARVALRKAANPEKARQTQTLSDQNKYRRNKDRILQRNRSWKVQNPEKLQAADARRRAAKLKRTPRWLTADDVWLMEEAYALAALRSQMLGFDWHVDHVVPLQGKLVSGLHVPHNLQVIPASENCSKSNRFVTT